MLKFTNLETRGTLEPKCVRQLFLGLLLGTHQSAIGQCFCPLPKTVPEVFAKVNSAQFFSLFLCGECLMKFRLL